MRTLALATLAAAAALIGAAPAAAQTVEELTVTGRLDGAHARSLSQTVSYADLDLAYAGDRERLRLRVNDTARRLCTQLNQDSPGHTNMGKSCQELAVRDAMYQVRQAFADAGAPAYVDAYGAPVSARVYDPGPPPTPPEPPEPPEPYLN
jgi:UrcA family protein